MEAVRQCCALLCPRDPTATRGEPLVPHSSFLCPRTPPFSVCGRKQDYPISKGFEFLGDAASSTTCKHIVKHKLCSCKASCSLHGGIRLEMSLPVRCWCLGCWQG